MHTEQLYDIFQMFSQLLPGQDSKCVKFAIQQGEQEM